VEELSNGLAWSILWAKWYLKQLHRMIYGFGMLFLACLGQTMTLRCSTDPKYLTLSMTSGRMPPVNYTVNGHAYNFSYYLADGIYPNWPTFVKAIRHPYEEKKVYFTQMQESCRKDIERAFGVLQARWAVLRGPAYGWDRNHLTEIMTACIIMHNMIVEDERPFAANIDFGDNSSKIQSSQIIGEGRAEWVINHFDLRRQERLCSLQNDLVEHLWARRGSM
jgi:hypothetical protein